ncbi:MAG TPA: hypothetical protein VFS51_00295 [Gemmatimonadales bacterium]|nr:hypothetical protein [Gemmatimonadales bacterium]
MRTIFLLPLTALVAFVAGCESEVGKQAASSVPERDLTLVTQTALVEIASPVETQQPQRAAPPAPARRSRRLEPKVMLAAVAAPAPVIAAPDPVAQPAGASTPANDRELLPGKTVTLIPASSGSSTGPDEAEEFPPEGRTMVVRRGGTCRGRGRGPGIGIAVRPRTDFR